MVVRKHYRATLLVVAVGLLANCASANTCTTADGVILQVLGSGGPVADDGRASSGYLLWKDGRAVVLIDAGGGTFLRFGEAGARVDDLDFVGLSHLHADHSVDFAALLKSGYFSNRSRSLIVAGPDGGGPFPGIRDFLSSLLDPDSGAFRYLSGYLDGDRGLAKLAIVEIDVATRGAVTILGDPADTMQIDAMPVPHGPVPALAYRVRIGNDVIVFASDQNGSNEHFAEFAQAASVLVMHMPVPEGVEGIGRKLHAPPSVIGAIAEKAQARSLLLSHFMARSLRNLHDNVDIVRSAYDGPIYLANDLSCYPLGNEDK